MQEPSADAETHSVSSALIEMAYTGPLCSFMEANITCVPLEIATTRISIWPSAAPDSRRLPSLVGQMAVTPLEGTTPPDALPTPVNMWASLMTVGDRSVRALTGYRTTVN